MDARFAGSVLLFCAIAGTAPGHGEAQSAFPPDSVVQALLDGRVQEGGSAGLAVGLLEPDGSVRFLAAGDPGPGRTLSPESVFEIGSITKVFTGILLADMVRRGEVKLEDPVSRHLPAGVAMPSRNGREIILEHLSTQTSGLPRLPGNLQPSDPLNPYADYTVEQMYAFLGGYALLRDPGALYEYSNLGVGLLGHVLSLRAGKSYEGLVRERILEPLGMEDTGIMLSPRMREQALRGHNTSGDAVPYWDLPTLPGAGALRSNIADMLTFIEAAQRGEGDLHESIKLSMIPRAPAGSPNMMIGLGWHRLATGADTIVWHDGGTGGFRTFAGLSLASGRGIVLLANRGGAGAGDIALHLLDPSIPLGPPPWEAVEVNAAALFRYLRLSTTYLGRYELTPEFGIEIALVDGSLLAQATGQAAIRLWPESETKFFIREVDARITFQIAADGTVVGLVLHQNGVETPGRKVRGSRFDSPSRFKPSSRRASIC